MALIISVLLGLGLLYVWLRGWWFAAVAMTLVGLLLGTFIGEAPSPGQKYHPAVSFLFTAAGGALAWLPWWFHRSRRQRQGQRLAGVQLVQRDAGFQG